MAKRKSTTNLLIMIGIAIVLFMSLALGEDYARGLIGRWQNKTSITGERSEMGKTVKRYNQILMQAYAQDRPSLLADVATEHQITKVRLYMTYDQIEKKRKLITVLKSLSIDETKKTSQKATAKTTETWENSYLSLETKKEFGGKIESYKVRYNLIKSGPDWLVDSLEAEKI